MIIALVFTFIFLMLFDYFSILKNKQNKILIVYLVLLSLGFTINLLLLLERAPTSPVIVIEKMVKLFF